MYRARTTSRSSPDAFPTAKWSVTAASAAPLHPRGHLRSPVDGNAEANAAGVEAAAGLEGEVPLVKRHPWQSLSMVPAAGCGLLVAPAAARPLRHRRHRSALLLASSPAASGGGRHWTVRRFYSRVTKFNGALAAHAINALRVLAGANEKYEYSTCSAHRPLAGSTWRAAWCARLGGDAACRRAGALPLHHARQAPPCRAAQPRQPPVCRA